MKYKQKIKALEEEVERLRSQAKSRNSLESNIRYDMRKYGLSYEEAKALQQSDSTSRMVWYSGHIDGNI